MNTQPFLKPRLPVQRLVLQFMKKQKIAHSSQRAAISLMCGAALIACSSVPKVEKHFAERFAKTQALDQINWPAQYAIKNATFSVKNQISIAAPPQQIWDILIQAENWPSWYPGAKNVRLRDFGDGRLRADSIFLWETMGLSFESRVTEYLPPLRLSWESRKSSIQGYHAWLLIPDGTSTLLVTEESQHGFLATMQRWFQPNKLHDLHETWLKEIKKQAEASTAISSNRKS